MKLNDAFLVWAPSWLSDNPNAGRVLVCDRETMKRATDPGRPDRMPMWVQLGVGSGTGAINADQRLALMFIDFHSIIVRDGIDPMAAHIEFSKVDEYREHISPDCPDPADQRHPARRQPRGR